MIEPISGQVVPPGVAGRTKSERVRAMFSEIVPRYDLMNRVMTFGLDAGWRRAAVSMADARNGFALDVGTGTADVALSLLEAGAHAVVGIDFAYEMLDAARAKLIVRNAEGTISLACGDALSLPFQDRSFDCVTNAFLLRNVADIPSAIHEFTRVVKPGGRIVCLELTHPPWFLSLAFSVYVAGIVPLLGALLTGHLQAYRYLPASLRPLPDAARLAAILRDAGLRDVSYRRVGLGSVAIHVGTRRLDYSINMASPKL